MSTACKHKLYSVTGELQITYGHKLCNSYSTWQRYQKEQIQWRNYA